MDLKDNTLEKVSGDNSEEGPSGPDSVEYPEQRRTFWQRIRPILWDTLDKPPTEKRLLLKIDACILTYCCLAYFMRTLDTSNLSNAYVSGMKEDLNFQGNDYNLALNTFFNIGYCVFMIPSQMVMPRVNRRWFLPVCDLLWGVWVCAMAGAKSPKLIWAMRFLIGMFETTAYNGALSMMGQWYKRGELAKRATIFQCSIYVASMFSGYLQTGLTHGMKGKIGQGLAPWRWLFIFDFVLTLVPTFLGILVIPNTPTSPKAWFLTDEERKLAIKRLKEDEIIPETTFSLKAYLVLFKDAKIYILTLAYMCQILGVAMFGYFNLWLKNILKLSSDDANDIPTGGNAIEIVFALLYGWISDFLKCRPPVIVGGLCIAVIAEIVLSIANARGFHETPIGYAGWFLLSAAPPENAMWQVFALDLFRHSPEQKMFVVGVMNALAFAFKAWVPLLLYPSGTYGNGKKAPQYEYGYYIAIMFFGIGIICALALWFLHRYEIRSGKVQREIAVGQKRAMEHNAYYFSEKDASDLRRFLALFGDRKKLEAQHATNA